MNYSTQRYHQLKSMGRCPYCGGKPENDEHVICAKCRQRERERHRARQAEETAYEHFMRNEENRINQKKRRERLRAAGLCPYCGEPALPGHTLCPKHNEENNRKARERTARKKAEKEAKK